MVINALSWSYRPSPRQLFPSWALVSSYLDMEECHVIFASFDTGPVALPSLASTRFHVGKGGETVFTDFSFSTAVN